MNRTIWEWIADYLRQAERQGNTLALQMARKHEEAYGHRQSNPQRMYALLAEGKSLAQQLHEPWWVAFFEHWQIETLIYYLDDYRTVLDRVIALTLELRKPIFADYPLRFGIYCNLVAAYLCIDPRGHADEIRQALAYLEQIVPEEGGDRYLLLARRHWFAYELAEYDEARRLALEELILADSDPDSYTALHHEVDTYKALCWVAFRQEDWASLSRWADLGEEKARQADYRYELALFLLWRALVALLGGDRPGAARLHRLALATMQRIGQAPGESYYDTLARYAEQAGQLPQAWAIREEELRRLIGKGQLAYEAQVRIKRVRLLRLLQRPVTQEQAAARLAIARLRAPQWYEHELARALQGEG
ncbi:MAG: hypothetical protein SNJ82_02325 [Gemmataceae bacterium]